MVLFVPMRFAELVTKPQTSNTKISNAPHGLSHVDLVEKK